MRSHISTKDLTDAINEFLSNSPIDRRLALLWHDSETGTVEVQFSDGFSISGNQQTLINILNGDAADDSKL